MCKRWAAGLQLRPHVVTAATLQATSAAILRGDLMEQACGDYCILPPN